MLSNALRGKSVSISGSVFGCRVRLRDMRVLICPCIKPLLIEFALLPGVGDDKFLTVSLGSWVKVGYTFVRLVKKLEKDHKVG